MLSLDVAIKIINKNIPNGSIQAAVVYEKLYVFQVFTDDGLEGQMDPFYSVDINTGEFRDFSILTDCDTSEIVKLFLNNSIYTRRGANV